MQPVAPRGATHTFSKPENWNEAEHGTCGALEIRVEQAAAGPLLVSAWKPSPDEIALLTAGGVIELQIVGPTHPPVWVSIEPPAA